MDYSQIQSRALSGFLGLTLRTPTTDSKLCAVTLRDDALDIMMHEWFHFQDITVSFFEDTLQSILAWFCMYLSIREQKEGKFGVQALWDASLCVRSEHRAQVLNWSPSSLSFCEFKLWFCICSFRGRRTRSRAWFGLAICETRLSAWRASAQLSSPASCV